MPTWHTDGHVLGIASSGTTVHLAGSLPSSGLRGMTVCVGGAAQAGIWAFRADTSTTVSCSNSNGDIQAVTETRPLSTPVVSWTWGVCRAEVRHGAIDQ